MISCYNSTEEDKDIKITSDKTSERDVDIMNSMAKMESVRNANGDYDGVDKTEVYTVGKVGMLYGWGTGKVPHNVVPISISVNVPLLLSLSLFIVAGLICVKIDRVFVFN